MNSERGIRFSCVCSLDCNRIGHKSSYGFCLCDCYQELGNYICKITLTNSWFLKFVMCIKESFFCSIFLQDSSLLMESEEVCVWLMVLRFLNVMVQISVQTEFFTL